MEEIPHTLDAIRVSQHIANYFVEQARHSTHRPESKEEDLAIQIYSTPMIFSARFEVRSTNTVAASAAVPLLTAAVPLCEQYLCGLTHVRVQLVPTTQTERGHPTERPNASTTAGCSRGCTHVYSSAFNTL
jgi:hypothetical protein